MMNFLDVKMDRPASAPATRAREIVTIGMELFGMIAEFGFDRMPADADAQNRASEFHMHWRVCSAAICAQWESGLPELAAMAIEIGPRHEAPALTAIGLLQSFIKMQFRRRNGDLPWIRATRLRLRFNGYQAWFVQGEPEGKPEVRNQKSESSSKPEIRNGVHA